MGAAVRAVVGATGDELGGDAQHQGEHVAEQELGVEGPRETLQEVRGAGLGQRTDEQS